MMDLEEVRRRWIEEKPQYDSFVEEIKVLLKREAARSGISCEIEGRAKGISNFLKKQMLKKYESPLDQMADKAGVRITVTYGDLLDLVDDLILKHFEILKKDDKSSSLPYDKLGYTGVHYDVVLRRESSTGTLATYAGMLCEIQVRTRAQALWATVSHELCYKPLQTPPARILRRVYRLSSLIEIFDEQIELAREAIRNLPDFREAIMLEELEKHYLRFTVRSFNRELSLTTIGELMNLYTAEELAAFSMLMGNFVDGNQAKLEQIFSDYAEDDRNPFMSQPESLLVFERIEKDPFRLRAKWNSVLPPQFLDSFGAIWGAAV